MEKNYDRFDTELLELLGGSMIHRTEGRDIAHHILIHLDDPDFMNKIHTSATTFTRDEGTILRRILKSRDPAITVFYKNTNPKTGKSQHRYEIYKNARTLDEVKRYVPFQDFKWDLMHGYVVLGGSPYVMQILSRIHRDQIILRAWTDTKKIVKQITKNAKNAKNAAEPNKATF